MVFFLETNQKRHNSLKNENEKTRKALLTMIRVLTRTFPGWRRIFLCRGMGRRRFMSWTFVGKALAASSFNCDFSSADRALGGIFRWGHRLCFLGWWCDGLSFLGWWRDGLSFLGWWRDRFSFLWRWFCWWSRFCLFWWLDGISGCCWAAGFGDGSWFWDCVPG
jgi:hypothetical protein